MHFRLHFYRVTGNFSRRRKVFYTEISKKMLTETAKLADAVLPITSFAENEGTYTNSEGRVQKLNKAMEPKTGKSNIDVIKSL